MRLDPGRLRELSGPAVAAAVAQQRAAAARREVELRGRLVEGGTRVVEHRAGDRAERRVLVAGPVLDEARAQFDETVWALLRR